MFRKIIKWVLEFNKYKEVIKLRKIVNKNSTYFYSYTGLISLIFFEIILLIFLSEQ